MADQCSKCGASKTGLGNLKPSEHAVGCERYQAGMPRGRRVADRCSKCGATVKTGSLRPHEHATTCSEYHPLPKGSKHVPVKPVIFTHVHNYAGTGRSKSEREKRRHRWYKLTYYEEKCQNKDCPEPTRWSEPHEQLE